LCYTSEHLTLDNKDLGSMDFDLSRLGPREFENLVQTLSIAEFGPGITIFGPGPDGGREATFEGPIGVIKEHPWGGYGVFQAKYCENPSASSKDADWFIQHCKKEFNAWASSAKRKRKPEYIIFATNVKLSGVAETGGLDRVAAELDKQCSRLGIRGWIVWHEETICRLLEKHPKIRTSYAAWVLPGDVLSELLATIAPARQSVDLKAAMRLYLAKELQRDRHVNLDQAGSADDRNVSLTDVFIDLPIDIPRHNYAADEAFALKRITLSCDQKFNRDSAQGQDAHRSQTSSRFVLVGGPGQGKSTVSQFLCQLYRAKLLEVTKAELGHDVKKLIGQILTQAAGEELRPRSLRWPVKIQLSQFADELASKKCRTLLQFIATRVADASDIGVTAHELRKWLATFPWLLLLDGLDEVPVTSNRDDVVKAIDDFMIDASDVDADIVVVATTRPQGYTEEFAPDRFVHLKMKPLEKSLALHYAKRLAVARYGVESNRIARLMERLQSAAEEASTARLMTSPLQVTIMAVLLDRVGKAPKDRYGLFSDYYRVIFERELEKEGASTNLLRDHRSEIDAIHADVGLLLQINSARSGDTESRIGIEDFDRIIRSRLESEGHESNDLDILCAAINRAATDRLVFLVPSRAGEVGFEIRSLQEFWAAESIMDTGDENIRGRLEAIAPSAHWRNVLLFAFGKIFAERKHLRDSVLTVVAQLNSPSFDGPVVERRLVLGSRLAVDVLVDGLAKAPKYEAVLIDHALKLLSTPASTDLDRLAVALTDVGLKTAKEILVPWARLNGASEQLFTFLAARARVRDQWAIELLRSLYDSSNGELRSHLLTLAIESDAAVLFDIAAAHSLDLPIAAMIQVLNKGFLKRGDTETSDLTCAPRWLSQLANILYGHDYSNDSAAMLSLDTVSISFRYRRFDELNEWRTLDVSSIPDRHWVYKVHVFVTSPSAATLADAIEVLIDAGFGEVTRNSVLPWPLAGLVNDCAHGEVSIAELRDERVVGSLPNWAKLEARWHARRRISVDDLKQKLGASVSSREIFFPSGSLLGLTSGDRGAIDVKRMSREIDNACAQVASWSPGSARTEAARLFTRVIRLMFRRHRRLMLSSATLEFLIEETTRLPVLDFAWLRYIEDPGRSVISIIDRAISNNLDTGKRVTALELPVWAIRSWVDDMNQVGLGLLVASGPEVELTDRQKRQIEIGWLEAPTDALILSTICFMLCRFLPVADDVDLRERVDALAEMVNAGHLWAPHVLESIPLAIGDLQSKFVMSLVDELASLSYSQQDQVFARLLGHQVSIPIETSNLTS